jgi:hypothetical protein
MDFSYCETRLRWAGAIGVDAHMSMSEGGLVYYGFEK